MRLAAMVVSLWVTAAAGEEAPPAPEPFVLPLKMALLNQSTQLPSVKALFSSFNPGAIVGAEYHWRRTPGFTLFQTLDLGVFSHPSVGTSAFVDTAFGWRPTLVAGLFFEVSLGIGYLAHFPSSPLFIQQGGTYRQAPGPLHRFLGLLSLGLGYRVGAFSPFVAYTFVIETPWFQDYLVVPNQLFQVGLRYELPLSGRTP
jgi:hypothetical protein